MKEEINRLTGLSNISNSLMMLTSIHHIYGAYYYRTPERLHVLFISIPVIIATLLFTGVFKRKPALVYSFLGGIYLFILLVPSLSLIGGFEGVYNHVLKNILYFSNTPEQTMRMLYKSDLYEMPNNFIFEISGIGQGIIAIPFLRRYYLLTRLIVNNYKGRANKLLNRE